MITASAFIIEYDNILKSASAFPALNILFFKLEPYIAGINKYGTLQALDSRSLFLELAKDIAVEGIYERPFLGLGPDNSRFLYYQKMGEFTNSHHNFYELLLNYGVFGTVIWYFFGVLYLIIIYKHRKSSYFPLALSFCVIILIASSLAPIYREPDIYVLSLIHI